MKTFKISDVDEIEKMLADGKSVMIDWHVPYERGNKVGIVKWVRWDGLVFTDNGCVFTGIDKLVKLSEV